MRPRLELRLGFTGHRPPRLGEAHFARVERQLGGVIAQFGELLAQLHGRHPGTFAPEPPRLVLISPLASGSDTLAATAALDAGAVLEATLPFDVPTYREDFDAKGSEQLDRLIAGASRVLSLPGNPDDRESAYRAVGAVNATQCDVLLAVWDGEPSRGAGGAADVIADAVAGALPVVMIDADDDIPPALLWNSADSDPHDAPTLDTVARQPAAACLPALVARLLAPPSGAEEFIADIARSQGQRWRRTYAYPALLALTGARGWRAAFAQADLEGSSGQIRPLVGCCGQEGDFAAGNRDILLPRFAAADLAANRFAPRYRGGFIGNFLLAALAVACGLMGLLAPAAKTFFVSAELVTIVAIIVRTRLATSAGWHRRWIDARQLAELLRVLPLSAALGDLNLLRADNLDEHDAPVWYARATAREVGLGEGRMDAARVAAVREQALELIEGQIGYHRANAERMELMEHRIRHTGEALFGATLISCLTWLGAKALGLSHAEFLGIELTALVTVLCSLLPAVGAALYGIRMQGDFAGSAERSRAIRSRLERLGAAIRRDPPDYRRLTARLRRLTEIMLSEVDQWRQLSEVRPVELPG